MIPAAGKPSAGWSGVLLAAAGAIAFSGKAIVIKLAYRHSVDATTLLALRMLVALPFFLVMASFANRQSQQTPLTLGDRWKVIALGFFGYYLSSFLDFAGLAYITATLERLILYLSPSMVMLLGHFVLRRRSSPAQWLALAISYAGVLVAFAHDLSIGGGGVLRGGALVLGSALSYAIYLVGSGELVARLGAMRLTAYASSVAAVLCIGQFLLVKPWQSLLELDPAVYWLSLINGTVCTVLPVSAVMLAIARIGSALTAQIGMLGPVSTIVLSLLLLQEPMGGWQIAGAVLVLGGVAMATRSGRAPTR